MSRSAHEIPVGASRAPPPVRLGEPISCTAPAARADTSLSVASIVSTLDVESRRWSSIQSAAVASRGGTRRKRCVRPIMRPS